MTDPTTAPASLLPPIWKTPPSVEHWNSRAQNTLMGHLEIILTEFGPNFLRGTMPVDHRTHQPIGLLHGGASVALAETLASIAANCTVDLKTHYCVGLEINANHIRSARSGKVTGTAQALHLGRTTQVWEIKIEQDGKLICVARMTAAVVKRESLTP